jgi:hypothetical protein
MCLLGHHRDELIYGRGRRRACTEPVLAQEMAQHKRPRVSQGDAAVREYDDTTPEGYALGCPEEPEALPKQPEVAGCPPEGEYCNVYEASDEEASDLAHAQPAQHVSAV